jgi:hypothetical protein
MEVQETPDELDLMSVLDAFPDLRKALEFDGGMAWHEEPTEAAWKALDAAVMSRAAQMGISPQMAAMSIAFSLLCRWQRASENSL